MKVTKNVKASVLSSHYAAESLNAQGSSKKMENEGLQPTLTSLP